MTLTALLTLILFYIFGALIGPLKDQPTISDFFVLQGLALSGFSSSEQAQGHLLPYLVHKRIGGLGCHLVASIRYLVPNLGPVRYLGNETVQFFFELHYASICDVSNTFGKCAEEASPMNFEGCFSQSANPGRGFGTQGRYFNQPAFGTRLIYIDPRVWYQTF